MTTRHKLLSELHELLRPRKYLEVGVQYGKSLSLAIYSDIAIGVDPHPQCQTSGNQQIFSVTSDDFFTYYMAPEDRIDLAFIDGSHLFEDALRDFMNVEQHSHPGTVVVFDDMLPLTQEMASRGMVPGHWTGDVWKVHEVLRQTRATDLRYQLVDTEPTGTMVVWNLNRKSYVLPSAYDEMVARYRDENQVPEYVVSRAIAVSPADLLYNMAEWWAVAKSGGGATV